MMKCRHNKAVWYGTLYVDPCFTHCYTLIYEGVSCFGFEEKGCFVAGSGGMSTSMPITYVKTKFEQILICIGSLLLFDSVDEILNAPAFVKRTQCMLDEVHNPYCTFTYAHITQTELISKK